MNFYLTHLAIFVAINTYLFWSHNKQHRQHKIHAEELPIEQCSVRNNRDRVVAFKLNFLLPYGFAVAADWVQGPHIYAIYKYDKGVAEKTIAALYATGFVSGALSATLGGDFADKCGRKLACLLYCVLYIATCLTMLSDSIPLLFIGRFAGGICTTILFSVFETWMISDYHSIGLTSQEWELNSAFSTMTTMSCAIAIVSGVFGDVLVQYGDRTWPFMAAIVCCIGAACLIMANWQENYGIGATDTSTNEGKEQNQASELRAFFTDPRVLSIGLTSCVFEGTMYLFIFFWSAAIKSTRSLSGSTDQAIPFGLIFSNFMCAMMSGSAGFELLNQRKASVSRGILHSVLLLTSCSLSIAVISNDESVQFWAFCLLEAAVGAYFPAIASIKNDVFANKSRGRNYSLVRLPLNIFVIIAHSLDKEGEAHRNNVFLVCGLLLLMTYFITRKY